MTRLLQSLKMEITNSTGKDITVNGDTFEVGETATAHVGILNIQLTRKLPAQKMEASLYIVLPWLYRKKDVQIIPAATNVRKQEATCKARGNKSAPALHGVW